MTRAKAQKAVKGDAELVQVVGGPKKMQGKKNMIDRSSRKN